MALSMGECKPADTLPTLGDVAADQKPDDNDNLSAKQQTIPFKAKTTSNGLWMPEMTLPSKSPHIGWSMYIKVPMIGGHRMYHLRVHDTTTLGEIREAIHGRYWMVPADCFNLRYHGKSLTAVASDDTPLSRFNIDKNTDVVIVVAYAYVADEFPYQRKRKSSG